jgi:hypothetical protein
MQPCILFYSINFIRVLVSITIFFVFFYYKFILIEKSIKHNKVNYSCCDVKYFDLNL